MAPSLRQAAWALAALGCTRVSREEAEDPALRLLEGELAAAPLCALQDARAALEGRDDLRAIDARRAIELAWRNRSPAQVSDALGPEVPPASHARERALRAAWREEHTAFSWDNLDPAAQLEPRPGGLSLSWLALAHALPLARNHQPFAAPDQAWIADYFARKAWYVPREGPLSLSAIDRVQMERVEQEVEALDPAALRAWREALPRLGMSEAEARIEAALADRALGGGSFLGEPAP